MQNNHIKSYKDTSLEHLAFQMATDYLNVRGEIVEMRQKKHELEEMLKKSDEEILRSFMSNDRPQQVIFPTSTALHVQPNPAEVGKYLELESEKV